MEGAGHTVNLDQDDEMILPVKEATVLNQEDNEEHRDSDVEDMMEKVTTAAPIAGAVQATESNESSQSNVYSGLEELELVRQEQENDKFCVWCDGEWYHEIDCPIAWNNLHGGMDGNGGFSRV